MRAGAAALPLYDWPEVRDSADTLWGAWRDRLRDRGIAAPDALDRETSMEALWRDPGLLAAQTCGAPFVDGRAPGAWIVATPISTAPGCSGPNYRSWLVTRRGDPARSRADLSGRRVAVNDAGSLSGWHALTAAGIRPGDVLWTGAHRRSALAVAAGEADFAAIDATAWALFQRHEPAAAAKLQAIEATPAFAAPPLITGADQEVALRQAVADTFLECMADPQLTTARDALFLGGAAATTAKDYAPVHALIAGAPSAALTPK